MGSFWQDLGDVATNPVSWVAGPVAGAVSSNNNRNNAANAPAGPPPIGTPDPNSNSIGGRTGISAYNGIGIPDYKNPYNVADFKNSNYYNIANGSSPSPWSRLASDQQLTQAANQNAGAKSQAQGAAGAVASRLAMQGGLTSGARERAQEQAGKNVISMVQGNNQTAANNVANIGIDDAKNRLSMLGDVTGKVSSMNASNIQGQNQYNQTLTQMLNQAVGANQAANAQTTLAQQQAYNDAHSGLAGHGGFLGLGL